MFQFLNLGKTFLVNSLKDINDNIPFPNECDYYNQIVSTYFYWLTPVEAEQSGPAIFRALNQYYWLPDHIICINKNTTFANDNLDSNIFTRICAWDDFDKKKYEFLTLSDYYPNGDIYFSYIPSINYEGTFARYAIIEPKFKFSHMMIEKISASKEKIKQNSREMRLLARRRKVTDTVACTTMKEKIIENTQNLKIKEEKYDIYDITKGYWICRKCGTENNKEKENCFYCGNGSIKIYGKL